MKKYLCIFLIIFFVVLLFNKVKKIESEPFMGSVRSSIDQSKYNIKWLDVAYSNESTSQRLDVYLPSGDGPFPLLIAVHGGAWEIGDKKDLQVAPIMKVVNNGYAVASINYRLSNEAKFPAQIFDVKAAIRFLRANAKLYNIMPNRFAIWGNSAGGHLAALVGTSGDISELENLDMGNKQQSSRVQAVVTWFGAFDLRKVNLKDPLVKLFGVSIEKVPDLVKMSNPAIYISNDDPPFLIEHGSEDRIVSVNQSIDFASALEKTIGKHNVKLIILKGAGHGDKVFESTQNFNDIVSFLDNTLK